MALAHSAASDLRQRLLTKVANQDFGYIIAKAKQFLDDEVVISIRSSFVVVLLYCIVVLLYCCRPFPKKVVSE